MKNNMHLEEWNVPKLSEDDMSDLLTAVRNAPEPRRKLPIAGAALAGLLIVAGTAAIISRYSAFDKNDVQIARTMLQEELREKFLLIDEDEDLRREYAKRGDRS